MDKSGSPITNDQDKANAFNTYFSSVGVPDNGVIPSCNDVRLCKFAVYSIASRSMRLMYYGLSTG